MVVERGICKKGEFSLWRDELQKKGFLFFQYEGPGTSHRPGPKLNEYLNKEKLANREIVVREDLEVFAKKADVVSRKEFEKKILELEIAIKNLINRIDPPCTEEKLQAELQKAKLEIVRH